MFKYALLGATLVGGTHAYPYDCGAPQSSTDLTAAGFGVGTVHLKKSGSCGGGPPDWEQKAKYYRVQAHVEVEGDYKIQFEYCSIPCGHEVDAHPPSSWTCTTTGNSENYYYSTYCLGEAQQRELEGLTDHCTADAAGACTAYNSDTYNCPAPGLQICGDAPSGTPTETTGAPTETTDTSSGSESSHSSDSSDSNHACHPTSVVKFTGFHPASPMSPTRYTITVDGADAVENNGETNFNVCKDFSIERTSDLIGHPLSITGLTSPAISGWSDSGKSTYSGEVGTTYSYVCDSHSQMKGTITVIDCNPCIDDADGETCSPAGTDPFYTCSSTCDTSGCDKVELRSAYKAATQGNPDGLCDGASGSHGVENGCVTADCTPAELEAAYTAACGAVCGDYDFTDGETTYTWAEHVGGASYVKPRESGTYEFRGETYTLTCTNPAYCSFPQEEVDAAPHASEDYADASVVDDKRKTFIDMCATLCSDANTGTDKMHIAFYPSNAQYFCYCATSEPSIKKRDSNLGWIAAKIVTC